MIMKFYIFQETYYDNRHEHIAAISSLVIPCMNGNVTGFNAVDQRWQTYDTLAHAL